MRTIPKQIIRHCGQRAAQHARWGWRDGQNRVRIGTRVKKHQWRAAHQAGLFVDHIITPNGLVVVMEFRGDIPHPRQPVLTEASPAVEW